MRGFIQDPEEMKALLAVARGEAPADAVLVGGQVVNVFTGETYPAEVAVYGGRIAGISREPGVYQGRETVDVTGEYIAPGFIDAHVHMESSLLLPAEFANAVLPHGTTSVVSDPHEIANVHGLEGIKFMLEASEGLPLRVFVMLSSCVPSTELETNGACLTADDLTSLLDEPRVLGIAEMMNYPGVIFGAGDMVDKAILGHRAGLRLDGHAPMVAGQALQAYAAAGIASDHESVGLDEALEKLRAGMQVFIREGSTARNLESLLPVVNETTSRFCSFSTDDKQPDDLVNEGHIDHNVRMAIKLGLDPVTAIQMASINTARHYGLNDLGAVAPGYIADLITFRDPYDLHITRTFTSGKLVARDGEMLWRLSNRAPLPENSMRMCELTAESFRIPASGRLARVIQARPDQIVTGSLVMEVPSRDGAFEPDLGRDILKIAVIERHKATCNIGLGLVTGLGLRDGALASSIAHDSHNQVVTGTNDLDMLVAAREVSAMGGGLCAARGGEVLARLPLPVAGLMSDRPLEEVRAGMRALLDAARSLGCPLDNPYMAMAFLALPVIPALKLTDRGLVDVIRFELVPLSVAEGSAS